MLGMQIKILFLLFICFLYSSCVTRPKLPSIENYQELNSDAKVAFIEELNLIQTDIQTFRALARTTLREGVSRTTLRQVIVFSRPEKLRLEFFATSFNRLVSLVVANDAEIQAIDFDEGIGYQGKASAKNIERLLTMPFSLEQSMLWFTGKFLPPAQRELLSSSLLISDDGGEYFLRLVYRDNRYFGLRYSASSDPEQDKISLRLLSLELRDYSKDQLLLFTEYFYDNYTKETDNDFYIPTRIKLFFPSRNIQVEQRYEKVFVNEDITGIPDTLFTILFPENVEVRTLR
jgi:outer membrane lipoprotein-sorting protein